MLVSTFFTTKMGKVWLIYETYYHLKQIPVMEQIPAGESTQVVEPNPVVELIPVVDLTPPIPTPFPVAQMQLQFQLRKNRSNNISSAHTSKLSEDYDRKRTRDG